MARSLALLITGIVLIGCGVLFYLLTVTGNFFGGASRPLDLGVYAVTIILLAFGAGALMLRAARLSSQRNQG